MAKTLLVSSLAEATHLKFKRIQFTPDLMPSDVTGTQVIQEELETGQRQYKFLPGPLFANIILADEINRTPPKTQAAMLEGMQERQVSAGGEVYKLPNPFFVLATQNPLEQEGTYPLPEAQLDRFLLYIRVNYPSGEEEWEIARRVTTGKQGRIEPVLSAEEIIRLQNLVIRVPVSDQVLGYAWALVRSTRPTTAESHEFVDKWVVLGRRPPRRADAGGLRQGPGDPPRPLPRHRRRRAGDRQAGPAPPHRRQLRGPGQQPHQRQVDRHASGSDARRPRVRTAGGVES